MQNPLPLTAHYFEGRARGLNTLVIVKGFSIAHESAVYSVVKGRREARQRAVAAGAKCWNF